MFLRQRTLSGKEILYLFYKERIMRLLYIIAFGIAGFNLFGQSPNNKDRQIAYEIANDSIKKRIIFCSPEIVRISVIKPHLSFVDSSLSVIQTPEKVDFKTKEKDGLVILKSSKLMLEIDKKSGRINFLSPDGKIFLKEHTVEKPVLTDTMVMGKNFLAVRQSFELTKDEGLYGLGQFQDGVMNYRNHDLLLVQANKIAVVGFLMSSNNYGILWDNYSRTQFHDGADGMYFSSAIADQIDYYFVAGCNMDGVVAGYRHLTGAAPMFSKKAYGFWQSKERYTSFTELSEVVQNYRDNNLPLDNIVQDWRYWGDNNLWSSMEFEPVNFPNPSENIDKLRRQNVDLMVSIWPSLGPDSKIYREMEQSNFLFSPKHWCGGKVYDAYNPQARLLYWNYIKNGLSSNGVDAFWMDGTEPEIGSTDTQEDFESAVLKIGNTSAGPVAKYLNPYALVTCEGVYNGHRDLTDKKRVFILTRSAWAGLQRYGAVTWSGDVSATWEVFRKQISAGLNFCMAGIPYWSHDIGAFFVNGRGAQFPGISDPAYQELYVRWFQFGAFSPIFRSHGTGTPREVWQLKDLNPLHYQSLKKSLNLRYALLPYIYSSAWQITSNNYTLMRGLVMDFGDDKNVLNIDDQYMFGSAFLVKPVTKNIYQGLTTAPKIVGSQNLCTIDGREGLTATYFNGTDLKEFVFSTTDKEINFNWAGGGLPNGLTSSNFSIRWEGFIMPSETGEHIMTFTADDGVRLWIDNVLVIDAWITQSATLYQHTMKMEKNKKYSLKIEYYQGNGGAFAALGWIEPKKNENKLIDKYCTVYLPAQTGWFDFWDNTYYAGGQLIKKEYPIDIFPLFAKAGSIVPFGPDQQFVGQHSEDTLQIKVYAGKDAAFMLYEDEGNTYNYEKGVYNTIELMWNEKESKFSAVQSKKGMNSNVNKLLNVTLIRFDKKTGKTYEYSKQIGFTGKHTEITF